ncbi:MAG: ATP-binding cassette domain-containing protein, partial [Anaerovoracaceae bacterium]|nr:ATP-binding cassette domain-containing protein [Anaerovoracaceae bacterium]
MLNGIKLTEITKDYGSFKLDKVSMTLPSGYIMGLIGENGAGKTTLIKILLGLIGKDAGEVQVFDRPFDAEDSDIREHIGVVMDECSFPEDMTTTQLDKVMASCYRTWDRETFAMRLDDFDIP